MIRRMEKAIVKRATITRNSIGERVETYNKLLDITIAISTSSGTTSVMNNVLTTSSTHIGITEEQGIKEGDIIVVGNTSYSVDFVVPCRRFYQLYLKIN